MIKFSKYALRSKGYKEPTPQSTPTQSMGGVQIDFYSLYSE